MIRRFFKRIINYILRWLYKGTPFGELLNSSAKEYPFFHQEIFINSTKGEFVKIYEDCKIRESNIGAYTYISEGTTINRTDIGKFCSIGPGVISGWGIHPTDFISTSPMFYSTYKQNGMTLSETNKIVELKRVSIGNDVFIGMRAIILDGITIGDGAVIGAGCIVTKDVPPYAIVVGSPMRIIKYRFDENTIGKLSEMQWWNWDIDRLQKVEEDVTSVEAFIKKNYDKLP